MSLGYSCISGSRLIHEGLDVEVDKLLNVLLDTHGFTEIYKTMSYRYKWN